LIDQAVCWAPSYCRWGCRSWLSPRRQPCRPGLRRRVGGSGRRSSPRSWRGGRGAPCRLAREVERTWTGPHGRHGMSRSTSSCRWHIGFVQCPGRYRPGSIRSTSPGVELASVEQGRVHRRVRGERWPRDWRRGFEGPVGVVKLDPRFSAGVRRDEEAEDGGRRRWLDVAVLRTVGGLGGPLVPWRAGAPTSLSLHRPSRSISPAAGSAMTTRPTVRRVRRRPVAKQAPRSPTRGSSHRTRMARSGRYRSLRSSAGPRWRFQLPLA
jgi:hypothetical protein